MIAVNWDTSPLLLPTCMHGIEDSFSPERLLTHAAKLDKETLTHPLVSLSCNPGLRCLPDGRFPLCPHCSIVLPIVVQMVNLASYAMRNCETAPRSPVLPIVVQMVNLEHYRIVRPHHGHRHFPLFPNGDPCFSRFGETDRMSVM